MYVVGLTGGIGTGKSAVAAMLAERGAVVLDADAIVHELQQPGTEVFREIVDAFGPQVVRADGTLDREALARAVFNDEDRRKRLEAIVHPAVGRRIAERLGELRDTDAIVVLDVPLLVESTSGSRSLARTLVVVAASRETQLQRLEAKGMSRHDAEARMAAQKPIDDKIAVADHVLWNEGSMEELKARVDDLWRKIEGAAA